MPRLIHYHLFEIFKDGEIRCAYKQDLYNTCIPADNLTYFIDVRVAKNNKPYLTITQTDAQGKQRVIVSGDKSKEFGDALK